MTDVSIVPYDAKYRAAVRDCVFVTGYGGGDVTPFFTDRELFADLLTMYYTDYEPEHAYIGLADGAPAGYLLGCADTRVYEETMKREVFPRILKNLARGKYRIDGVTARYIARGLLSQLRGEGMTPPLEQFPAHLHIDLFEPYRRLGLGARLVGAWLDDLRGMGSPGIHLGTSTAHTQSHGFYQKLGFRRYAVRRFRTSIFKDRDQRDLYSVYYVMSLRPHQ